MGAARPRRDETFRPWVGAVNAARAHVRLAGKRKGNYGSSHSLSIKHAGFSCLLRFAYSHSRSCFISTPRALRPPYLLSGSSLRSRLTALYGGVRERVLDALHTGMRRALAVMTSHYAGLDL
jgi:hypothetical protein